MDKIKFYEKYHSRRKRQKRIINDNNLTYTNILSPLNSVLYGVNNILDIGCGVGTLSLYLGNKGYSVEGIDISNKAIAQAKSASLLFGLGNNVKFYASNIESLKFKKRYDLIILSEVLEHLEDEEGTLGKVNKLLKRGGILFCTVPSKNAPLYRLRLLRTFDKSVGHLRRYDDEALSRLLVKNKFKIIKTYKKESILRNLLYTNNYLGITLRFIRGPLVGLFTYVDNILTTILGESQIIIIAQKK